MYAAWDSVNDAYYNAGSHPDIVERLWDQIGAKLPVDCRCLIHGYPSLAHPSSGVVFGITAGTSYCLYLPNGIAATSIEMGARTYLKATYGNDLDTLRDLGNDWVFGAWLVQELTWCRTVYESVAKIP
jgi:hypothetical protein